jgi:hypothetical protein
MAAMGKGRWAGVGCATLFALPFCAAGIAVIFSAPRSTGRDLVMRVGAGSVFVVAGLALIFGAMAISGAAANSFQLRQRFPDQPWMWRRLGRERGQRSGRARPQLFLGFRDHLEPDLASDRVRFSVA